MAEYFETSTKLRSLFTSPQLLYEEFNNQLPNFRRHKRDGYVRNDFIINILPHAAEDSASSHVATSTGTHPFLPPVENREKQEADVFKEEESEVLFTMGAVFRLLSAVEESKGFWTIQLQLTDEEDETLKKLAEHMKDDVFDVTPIVSLGNLMLILAKYDKAEQYYLSLLNDPNFTAKYPDHEYVYDFLGLIYEKTGLLGKGVEYLEKSLEMKLKQYSATDPRLGPT
ncbi:unnamed protein product, partial [Rotaria sp. Silwood2]